MWGEEGRPLPLDMWLLELGKLCARCSYGPRSGEERVVRRAFHLARLSPLGVRRILLFTDSESDLEAVLEAGDVERAALMVVGGNAMVETDRRGEEGRHFATFVPYGEDPVRFEAESPALAMIGAWAHFLTTVRRS